MGPDSPPRRGASRSLYCSASECTAFAVFGQKLTHSAVRNTVALMAVYVLQTATLVKLPKDLASQMARLFPVKEEIDDSHGKGFERRKVVLAEQIEPVLKVQGLRLPETQQHAHSM